MKIEDNIRKIIKGTVDGKVRWAKINPTTYNWQSKSSDGKSINTVVQKSIRNGEPNILFRLWNLDEQTSLLDLYYIDSSDAIKSLLKELYETVSGNALFVDDIFSDILRDI
jgi:hypothetical protein